MIRTFLSLSFLGIVLALGACDSPMADDGGIDAHSTRDVSSSFDGDATALSDVRSGSDIVTVDTSMPYDGASGIGNGTCAETGSFCLTSAQCCSGFCNTTTMWSGGGICDMHSGTPYAGDAGTSSGDGGDCAHVCHCMSNQHCCLVQMAGEACGVALQCSVIEGCM